MTLRAIWLPLQVTDAVLFGYYNAKPTWAQTGPLEIAQSAVSYLAAVLTLVLLAGLAV